MSVIRFKVVLMFLALALASPAMAVKGPPGVQWTVHNLSATGVDPAYRHGNEEQVCIFCHTPHGADTSSSVPLWNRVMPSTSYTHYTSTQIQTAIPGATAGRVTGPESIACLSCHDGSIAVNEILNYSNQTGGKPLGNIQDDIVIQGLFTMQGGKIGDSLDPNTGMLTGNFGDLFDDHPISFSYDATKALSIRGAEFQTVNYATTTGGVRFFGATNRVECSSCHDPHVNYWNVAQGGNADYTPFLMTPNNGSALCFACHIK